jgi:hypothetical protein
MDAAAGAAKWETFRSQFKKVSRALRSSLEMQSEMLSQCRELKVKRRKEPYSPQVATAMLVHSHHLPVTTLYEHVLQMQLVEKAQQLQVAQAMKREDDLTITGLRREMEKSAARADMLSVREKAAQKLVAELQQVRGKCAPY